jgi:serine/threonine protein phosphatase PrpC
MRNDRVAAVRPEMELRYVSAGATQRRTARQINEDSMLYLPALGVWAVADGMGGHRVGGASSTVVRALDTALPALVLSTLRQQDCTSRAEALIATSLSKGTRDTASMIRGIAMSAFAAAPP